MPSVNKQKTKKKILVFEIINSRNRTPNLRKTEERGKILSVSSATLLPPKIRRQSEAGNARSSRLFVNFSRYPTSWPASSATTTKRRVRHSNWRYFSAFTQRESEFVTKGRSERRFWRALRGGRMYLSDFVFCCIFLPYSRQILRVNGSLGGEIEPLQTSRLINARKAHEQIFPRLREKKIIRSLPNLLNSSTNDNGSVIRGERSPRESYQLCPRCRRTWRSGRLNSDKWQEAKQRSGGMAFSWHSCRPFHQGTEDVGLGLRPRMARVDCAWERGRQDARFWGWLSTAFRAWGGRKDDGWSLICRTLGK